MKLKALAAGVATAGIIATGCATTTGAAMASTTPDLKLGVVKVNDLAEIGFQYTHDFHHVACGTTTGVPCDTTTVARKIPVYCDTWLLRQAVANGTVKPGDTVLFDFEHWSATPAYQQANPVFYLIRAAQLARRHGVTLIVSVNFNRTVDLGYLAAVAPYAGIISVQNQGLTNNPTAYLASTRHAIAVIRQHSRSVPIWVGLATDPGGHRISSYVPMVQDWRETHLIVQGYFFNAAVWNGGTGYPQIARNFLNTLGG